MSGARWLLVKDLQLLRRSPLILALLVLYPVLVAVLIGVALSRGPEKPKVAFLNQVSPGSQTLALGGRRIAVNRYANQLFKSIDPVPVKSRQQAIQKVKSGAALGALIVPADLAQKLSSQLERPTVEVFVTEDDPVKARFVRQIINSQVAQANEALSRLLTDVAVGYLDLLMEGGRISVLGHRLDVLGLVRAEQTVRSAARALPEGSAKRTALERVARFARLARDNLDVSDELLATVAEPIRVTTTVVSGRAPPMTSYAVAIAVTFSLMFVTILLAAGAVAVEREENTFQRLMRGLVSPTGMIVEKALLAQICSVALALVMLGGLGAFVSLDWSRFPLMLVGLAAGAAAFAAMGVAIGSLAREVRAASLIAVMLVLPVAFLALVPSGTVSAGLYQAARIASAPFPFRPTLQTMNVALYGSGASLVLPLLHLAALALAYGLAARLALRRLGQ